MSESDCDHGQRPRVCEICALEAEVARLKAAYSLLLRAAEQLRPWRPEIRGRLLRDVPDPLLDAILGVIAAIDPAEETIDG